MRLQEKITTDYTDVHNFFCANLWQKIVEKLSDITIAQGTNTERRGNYSFG